MNYSWTSYEQVITTNEPVTNKLWPSPEQVMNKSWASHKQILHESWTSNEQVISKSNLDNKIISILSDLSSLINLSNNLTSKLPSGLVGEQVMNKS